MPARRKTSDAFRSTLLPAEHDGIKLIVVDASAASVSRDPTEVVDIGQMRQ
jgi:hypothetical protein